MTNEVIEGAIIPVFVYDKLNYQTESEKVNNPSWSGRAGSAVVEGEAVGHD